MTHNTQHTRTVDGSEVWVEPKVEAREVWEWPALALVDGMQGSEGGQEEDP